MPTKPMHQCSYPGCRVLVSAARCEKHARDEEAYNKARLGKLTSRHGHMYDRRWQNARKMFLRRNPWCVNCLRDGHYVPATVVDHVKPHKGDNLLMWRVANWQALCKRCHDEKTMREFRR